MSPVTVMRPVPETATRQPGPATTVRSTVSIPEAGSFPEAGAVVAPPPGPVPARPAPTSPQPLGSTDLNSVRALSERRTQTLWRARALRYTLIYLLMASALVTLRYQTREVYPQLRELRAERTVLQDQQRDLSLRVQTLTSEQRVRAWALSSGMVPYAQAAKQTQAFGPALSPALLPPLNASPPSAPPPLAPLSVRTVLK